MQSYDCFGARYYDSDPGHWLSLNTLADKYPGWSPYNYCLNNSLIIIDPNGKWGINVNSTSGKVPDGFPSKTPGGTNIQYLSDGKDFKSNIGYIDKINGFAAEGGEWITKNSGHYAPNVAKYLEANSIKFAFASNLPYEG